LGPNSLATAAAMGESGGINDLVEKSLMIFSESWSLLEVESAAVGLAEAAPVETDAAGEIGGFTAEMGAVATDGAGAAEAVGATATGTGVVELAGLSAAGIVPLMLDTSPLSSSMVKPSW